MFSVVRSIDEKFLQNALVDQDVIPNKKEGWIGRCPFCKSKRDKYQSHKPACLIVGRDEGYVFHCCCCNLSITTYKFLRETQGLDTAEKYAQERWDAGELCGGGWNCPLPQKVREELAKAKEASRMKYQEDYERRRMENYELKYSQQD